MGGRGKEEAWQFLVLGGERPKGDKGLSAGDVGGARHRHPYAGAERQRLGIHARRARRAGRERSHRVGTACHRERKGEKEGLGWA